MGMSGLFGQRLSKAASGIATGLLGSALSVSAFADEALKSGQPTDKAMGFQPAVTELGGRVTWFYNDLLFPVITVISLFVLALLIWIVVRYNKKANPNPAKFSHNTLIEIIWTVIPVLILVVIAVFSLRLLKDFNDMPQADVVVKVTGNQWYWTYDYPELGVSDLESRLLPEAGKDPATAKAAGVLYLLDVDNELVVPVNKVVHIQTTATDVIHSFTVPAFRIKMDAVPGRLNNTWFKATKPGTYYGQCSELCGKDHAYMPIKVHVVSDAEFDAFVIKNGGKTKAMLAQEAAAKAQADAATAAAAAASSAAAASAAPVSAAATSPAAAPAPAAAKPASTPAPAAPSSAAAPAH
jgi:cytochrome c oxidase subunit 2